MSEAQTCFACYREARLACPRCGRFYCELHGDLLCSVCLTEEEDEPEAETAPLEVAAAASAPDALLQTYPDAYELEDEGDENDEESLPEEGYDADAQPSPFPEPAFNYQPAFRPSRDEPQYADQPPFVTCFACDREPVQQCPRCGRPYCEDHGEEVCAHCLQPATGVPSFSLYRGSLLALGFAALLAIWLIVQPSNGESNTGLRPVVLTPTAAVAAANSTPGAATTPGASTTPASGTPSASRTPAAGTTPGASTTPAAGGTPSSGASGSYTVASGDTLSGICSNQRPSLSNADCVTQLRTLNNISGDSLSIGQSLRLP